VIDPANPVALEIGDIEVAGSIGGKRKDRIEVGVRRGASVAAGAEVSVAGVLVNERRAPLVTVTGTAAETEGSSIELPP